MRPGHEWSVVTAQADLILLKTIPSRSARFFFFERCQTTPGYPFSGTSGSPV